MIITRTYTLVHHAHTWCVCGVLVCMYWYYTLANECVCIIYKYTGKHHLETMYVVYVQRHMHVHAMCCAID